MRRVAIANSSQLTAAHAWEHSLSDLILHASEPLLERAPVDALFLASPSALAATRQSDMGAIAADRLCLPSTASVVHCEHGDGSGAVALQVAHAYVAAGLSRCGLVVAAAKTSDLSEAERWALLDATIDQEAEAALGLSYAQLHGLLADLYLRRHALNSKTFSHAVAKNAANACRGGETYLRYAPTAREIALDITLSRPLRRSDFAPLFDGACALLVCDLGLAPEIANAAVEIRALSSARDLTILFDRTDPLRFEAVARASHAALERSQLTRDALSFFEIDNACSLTEMLGIEALELAPAGRCGARLAEGFGRLDSAVVVNPGGGAMGRGYVYGASGLYQARELWLQLTAAAEARQVATAAQAGAAALALSIAGLGSQAHALVCQRIDR